MRSRSADGPEEGRIRKEAKWRNADRRAWERILFSFFSPLLLQPATAQSSFFCVPDGMEARTTARHMCHPFERQRFSRSESKGGQRGVQAACLPLLFPVLSLPASGSGGQARATEHSSLVTRDMCRVLSHMCAPEQRCSGALSHFQLARARALCEKSWRFFYRRSAWDQRVVACLCGSCTGAGSKQRRRCCQKSLGTRPEAEKQHTLAGSNDDLLGAEKAGRRCSKQQARVATRSHRPERRPYREQRTSDRPHAWPARESSIVHLPRSMYSSIPTSGKSRGREARSLA